MKCSIKTVKAIQELLIEEFSSQILEQENCWLDECEQALRNSLVEIGKETLGSLLSVYDEQANDSAENVAVAEKQDVNSAERQKY